MNLGVQSSQVATNNVLKFLFIHERNDMRLDISLIKKQLNKFI